MQVLFWLKNISKKIRESFGVYKRFLQFLKIKYLKKLRSVSEHVDMVVRVVKTIKTVNGYFWKPIIFDIVLISI